MIIAIQVPSLPSLSPDQTTTENSQGRRADRNFRQLQTGKHLAIRNLDGRWSPRFRGRKVIPSNSAEQQQPPYLHTMDSSSSTSMNTNRIQRSQSCTPCEGSGLVQTSCQLCTSCMGKKCIQCRETGYISMPFHECDTCGGSGVGCN
ncbi:hypothetical protein PROFUN_12188 [Planoprotostelium fungivorum]|uniref:Uncharacterized protein n=1 Tax=Planoprotostelium fungivorum TaxID=1890364 RepID=A0A2P6N8H4_9EUKA|nr:hypothetical protein PROFUN_12188 [Planoprotostelium fungivorum]